MKKNNIKTDDLVLLRLETKYGYSNTWWRVMFIDDDGTFIGRLERKHWIEYEDYNIGDDVRFDTDRIEHIYDYSNEEFCYGDNITLCNCVGLCKDK